MQQLAPHRTGFDDVDLGPRLYALCEELFPICRSITGEGVRETLRILGRHAELKVTEVASGTPVFDWTVPREWVIRDAYIANAQGTRVVDFHANALHVLNYSTPVRTRLPLAALREHIYTLPDQPDLIPYRTSYYAERWGFCMSHNALLALPEGEYDVVIDSALFDGSLTYAEYVKPGQSTDEVLLSAHVCHPSLANDNCSGLAVLTLLAADLARRNTRLSYRVLFAPGTIGAITWLARNEDGTGNIKHGLVVSCAGDGASPSYKQSRRGNAAIDRAMAHVLTSARDDAVIEPFSPYGYDERQYCSPGFNLPVGLFQRSRFGKFPQYHTSGDNLDFITPDGLAQSYRWIRAALDVIENDRVLINTNPKCEPALGKRGLYATMGGDKAGADAAMALLWVLNFSDGGHSLLDIAERAQLPFHSIDAAARRLEAAGLLVPAGPSSGC